MWLLAPVVVALGAFLTLGPMFDAPRRGDSAWTWIVAGILLGPLSGVAYYASRRGMRLAAARNAPAGGQRVAP